MVPFPDESTRVKTAPIVRPAAAWRNTRLAQQPEDIVPGNEQDERDQEQEGTLTDPLLGALGELFATRGFNASEHDMAAVQGRHRQEVEDEQRHGDHRHANYFVIGGTK